jgi:hypothetical protein
MSNAASSVSSYARTASEFRPIHQLAAAVHRG